MKLSSKLVVAVAAVAVAIAVSLTAAVSPGKAERAGQPTYTVCIDIPFHPIFDYVMAKKDTYFARKPYKVNFKVLDATTQLPAFGAGQCNVITTPPSFIPRVTDRYRVQVRMFFPLARWVIGPQILVKVNSPYKTLGDLEGKRVAISPLSTRFGSEEAAIIAATGENIRTYFKLKQTDAAAQELSLGRVDAAFIEAPTTYPLLQSKKFKAIYSVHDAFLKAFGDPAVVNGGYIARTTFIKNAPSSRFVKDLIAATSNAWNRYRRNSKEVNEVASEISGIPAEQLEVVGDVLYLKKMSANLRKITPRDVRSWSKLFPLLEQSGFIKKAPANTAALFVVSK
ncbi:MAG: ABC transporter substrate-binding protein [Gaiellaceae bacterium]